MGNLLTAPEQIFFFGEARPVGAAVTRGSGLTRDEVEGQRAFEELMDSLGMSPAPEPLEARASPDAAGTASAPEEPGLAAEPGRPGAARPHALPAPLCELAAIATCYRSGVNYAAMRERFMAASFSANEEGRVAPAFRQQPKPPPGRVRKTDFALHRDRMVVDLHWLWRRFRAAGAGLRPKDAYRHLVEGDTFDRPAAEAYAKLKRTSESRAVEDLSISPDFQWELATLKSEARADRHRELFSGRGVGRTRIHSGVAKVNTVIASWALRTASVRDQQEVYSNLWVAREMLGPRGTNRQISTLAALMTGGIRLDQTTVRKKLAQLDRQLAAAATA